MQCKKRASEPEINLSESGVLLFLLLLRLVWISFIGRIFIPFDKYTQPIYQQGKYSDRWLRELK